MSRHRLFLDSPTQVGKNRITLPKALADYYGNTATAYVGGRQVESKTVIPFKEDWSNGINSPWYIRNANVGLDTTKYVSGGASLYYDVADVDGVELPLTGLNYNGVVEFDVNVDYSTTARSMSFRLHNDSTIIVSFTIDSRMMFYNGSAYDVHMSGVVVDTWYHIKLESTTTHTKLWIDGVYKGESSNNNTGTPNKIVLYTYTSGANYFHIDNISFGEPYTTFTTPTPTREMEIGRGNLELGDIETRYLSYDIADYVDVPTMNMGDTYTIEATFLYTLDSGSLTIPVFGKEKVITLEALPSNPWRFITGSGSGWGTIANANTTLSTDTIYHIAVVVNSNSVSFYLDGESNGSGTVSNNFNTDFWLSRRDGQDTRYAMAGNIYDFRLWNKALSQSELNAYITGDETDLALWYSDEGTESVLTDKAGSNNGTITGATWRILTDSELEELGGLKTEEVLHWTPSSESGYYWVLTEDASGNQVYIKVAGEWKEGTLYLKTGGTWVQADDVNVKASGTWK